MTEKIHLTLTVPEDLKGMRLDQALAKLLPNFSRTQIQTWIKEGAVLVNHQQPKTRDLVRGSEEIVVHAAQKTWGPWQAEPIILNIVHEDDALLIINKPTGMVVHPAAGNPSNTLLNALLHHVPSLNQLPRAGMIHRLDKDTSGLLVIAKTQPAFIHLSRQMKARSIARIYQAIVNGVLISGGTINEPISRHPIQRKQMAVNPSGKNAITHYRVVEKYRHHTRIKVQLETGRTHQIRVHMAYIQHAILGDQTYGGRLQLPRGASQTLIEMLRTFKHQALHAAELGLIHPLTEKEMRFTASLPDDMQKLIEVLKADAKHHST
ncbi:MAG: hypothetical protein ACD_60C00041G0021 [uncultured bacterium]|nr:MAG: hypothetical protein ACD_60C00041G0021 [uncultured bacterium]